LANDIIFYNFKKNNAMISEKLQKGCLLIAEPSILGDVSFNRSVILLADHNENGSVGFILNKPLTYSINDLIPDVEVNFSIYNGGPVEQDNLYFIHKIPDLIPDSIEISNGIFWGGDYETTKTLLNSGLVGRDDIRFFLGYSGWDSNQLEEEMQANSWIVANNIYKNNIFKKSVSSFWKDHLEELGGEYLLWINAPENPMLN
jgi:putative transcriptional regulator